MPAFVAPYVNEVGKFIQKIAQPLFDNAVGRAAVSAMQSAASAVVEVAYKTVEAGEWLIDKGTDAVNLVGEKATQSANWIADTSIVQGTVSQVQKFGSWITSTKVWQTAVEIGTYVFTKMSNFCTAVVESYLYYNQCRTASRRLAIEKQGLINEHTILETFHGISQQEGKKTKNEKDIHEVSEHHISL